MGTFVSLVLNVIVFDYNGLKQSLILQTKQNRLLQISFFFFIGTLFMFILKKYLALYVERLGYQFGTILVTFVGIPYFALQICINPTRDIFLPRFYDKSMFSKDGLKCHLKRCKQFFEENMDLSKKLVCCFASLVLYIFFERTMYECSILCC